MLHRSKTIRAAWRPAAMSANIHWIPWFSGRALLNCRRALTLSLFWGQAFCKVAQKLTDPAHPAEFVDNVAALDADQLRLDGGRYLAGRTVGDHDVARAALDLAD